MCLFPAQFTHAMDNYLSMLPYLSLLIEPYYLLPVRWDMRTPQHRSVDSHLNICYLCLPCFVVFIVYY